MTRFPMSYDFTSQRIASSHRRFLEGSGIRGFEAGTLIERDEIRESYVCFQPQFHVLPTRWPRFRRAGSIPPRTFCYGVRCVVQNERLVT